MKKDPLLISFTACLAYLVTGSASVVLPSWAADSPSQSAISAFGVHRFASITKAPPFTLRALDGKTVSLSDLEGRPALLFFWGTWCVACKEDIVSLEKFAGKAKDQLTIITVLVDGERQGRAKRIVETLKITMPVLLVCKEDVIDTYQVRMIPMAIFIDCAGHLVGKVIGQRDWTAPLAWTVTKELLELH